MSAIVEESEENDTILILLVHAYALDNVNKSKRLIGTFNNADKMLHYHYLNKVESFLYSKCIKNVKQTKIDNFFK